MILFLTMMACGPPDLHAELECPDCEAQLVEHFGIDVESADAREMLLEGLEILATWELTEASWAQDAPGETPTARAYNELALWIEESRWGGQVDMVELDGHELVLGTWAEDGALHGANLTLNLMRHWRGDEIAGTAAAEAASTCFDEALCEVLEAWAARF